MLHEIFTAGSARNGPARFLRPDLLAPLGAGRHPARRPPARRPPAPRLCRIPAAAQLRLLGAAPRHGLPAVLRPPRAAGTCPAGAPHPLAPAGAGRRSLPPPDVPPLAS